MEQSEKAKAFLAALDQTQLKVGDGSDGLPVWVGVDAEAGKVYKVYATGLAQGFGDGMMIIKSGMMAPGDWRSGGAEQITIGRHVMLEGEGQLRCYELDPQPLSAESSPIR